MERSQFTFYKSFADAIQRIRKPADRAIAYDIVVNYALNGTLPDLEDLPDSVCIIFDLVRPNLEAGRRKAQGGRGASKPEESEEPEESSEEDSTKMDGSSEEDTVKTGGSSEEDTENKKKNKKERESEKEDKKKKEDKCQEPPLTPQRREELIQDTLNFHGSELLETVREWIRYKIEKRQGYKETGLKAMLTQIEKHATEYGDQAVVEVIRNSMSSNYQGIMFDRLKGKPKAQGYGSVGAWLNGAR